MMEKRGKIKVRNLKKITTYFIQKMVLSFLYKSNMHEYVDVSFYEVYTFPYEVGRDISLMELI
jgi:hypothetical protein